jgi:hypothetical protein
MLFKHACHIRAVTCHGPAILEVLLASGCTSIVEINHLVPLIRRYQHQGRSRYPLQPRFDLGHLCKSIAMNPQLRAVSLEIPEVESKEHK